MRNIDKIILVGTDCTLGHAFHDYLKYNVFYDNGIRKSPFGATYIFNPKNKGTNYGSLSVVAACIKNKFKGWDDFTKNFRGKKCSKYYPVEFTHAYDEKNINREAIPIFLNRIETESDLIFCSIWRTYHNFNQKNFKADKEIFDKGIYDFKSVIKNKHELLFFFVMDRNNLNQLNYIKNLMSDKNIEYHIVYNETDKNKNRKFKMKFDCNGWEFLKNLLTL